MSSQPFQRSNPMLIDWFTVGAQVINFIVLVWLLKRFLYKPVLNAIDMREKRVAAESATADLQMTEIKKSREELQARSRAFEEERGALLAKAILDAKTEAERLLGSARQAADALTSQRNAALHSDTARLSGALSRLATGESINIARAALKDLAGADLEARICEVFVHRLRGIDSPTKESLGGLLTSPTEKPVVTSSFELSSVDKIAIQTALNETFSADIHLRFELSPDMIGGIALNAGGERLSWTIADYLKTLEERTAALLSVESVAGGMPVDTPPVRSATRAIAQPALPVSEPDRDIPAAAA
jgi:F-type H+-transporting ATPase subunit b